MRRKTKALGGGKGFFAGETDELEELLSLNCRAYVS